MKRLSLILFFIFSFFFIQNVFADSQYTSGVTAQAIIERVQYNLNADDEPIFTTTEMLDWINQGILDIAARSQCLQGSYERSLVTDVYKYDLSGATSYLNITNVVYKDSNGRWVGLVEATPENLTLGMEDYPKFWYEDNVGSSIIIFPTMSVVTDDPSVIIFYIEKPTIITAGEIATTEIPLPAKYDQALIYYVTHKALERDRRDSTDMYNRYLESVLINRAKKVK